MIIVMLHDSPVDFDACVNLMDDDIRESIHSMGIDNPQDFLDRYCAAHVEKYNGEQFTI